MEKSIAATYEKGAVQDEVWWRLLEAAGIPESKWDDVSAVTLSAQRAEDCSRAHDIRIEWDEEWQELTYIAEIYLDCRDWVFLRLLAVQKPKFVEHLGTDEWTDADAEEYGKWYDIGLEEVHRQGFVLDAD